MDVESRRRADGLAALRPDVAHDLEASYEDVQEGMSTPLRCGAYPYADSRSVCGLWGERRR